MIGEFAILTGKIVLACLLISCLFFLFNYRKFNTAIKVLGLFLIINLIVELYAKWLSRQYISNIFLLHIYTLLEFLTWSLFYRILFKDKKWVQNLFPWFVIGGGLLIIANTIFLEPMTGFNSNAKTFVQLFLMSCAVYYFFNAFGKIDFSRPASFSISMINFAVILYYSGTLFIFMFSKLLKDHEVVNHRQHLFWAINAVLNLIFQILILISLWIMAFRKAKS